MKKETGMSWRATGLHEEKLGGGVGTGRRGTMRKLVMLALGLAVAFAHPESKVDGKPQVPPAAEVQTLAKRL